jgi:hypothetical protein
VRRPFHDTSVVNRSLFVGGEIETDWKLESMTRTRTTTIGRVETDPGLAPGKTWVAVTRLDDFAMQTASFKA